MKRLASDGVDVKPALAAIIETDRVEREMEAGSQYADVFKKINIRRTEISVGVYTIQVLCGIVSSRVALEFVWSTNNRKVLGWLCYLFLYT